jgi:MoxR-like ATPase
VTSNAVTRPLLGGATTVEDVEAALAANDYLADRGLATSIFLALSLRRPLFLEGEAGVGKTEVAKVLSRWLGSRFIRLQCYEGIDAAQALYEWDYARQLLHLRTAEAAGRIEDADRLESELYSDRFLVRRPLLEALDSGDEVPPVLLIDEIDRADDEFEAFLLEALSDYTVTIPEYGTVTAVDPPVVILTSNRTRDVHDALKRRALYHWVEHPSFSAPHTLATHWRARWRRRPSSCVVSGFTNHRGLRRPSTGPCH